MLKGSEGFNSSSAVIVHWDLKKGLHHNNGSKYAWYTLVHTTMVHTTRAVKEQR